MKKSPKKFYIKKTVKIKKKKSGGARSRFARLNSPSIFRSIPERANKIVSHLDRFTLISFSIGILVVLLGISLLDLQLDKKRLVFALNEKEKLIFQRNYWSHVIGENAGYRDGYFMLAVSEYRLGNLDEAQNDVQKALIIDPFFEEGKKLQQKIIEELK